MDPITGSLIGAALTPITYPITHTITSLVNTASDPYFDALRKNAAATANFRLPFTYPGVDACVKAFWLGLLDEPTVRHMMRFNGVYTSNEPLAGTNPDTVRTWQAITKSSRPMLAFSFALSANAQGKLSDELLTFHAKANGLVNDDLIQAWKEQNTCPSYDAALTQFEANVIGQDELDTVARIKGVLEPEQRDFIGRFSAVPSVSFVIDLFNRELIPKERMDEYVRAAGFRNPSIAREISSIAPALRVPPPSDLVRFAVRECFTPAVSRAEGLYNEYPDSIDQYAKMLGMGRREIDVGLGVGPNDLKSWMQIQWAAHWQPISATQAYEMLHRIRPDTIAKWNQLGFNLNPFTIDDVKRWLQIQDYPPAIREYVAAISYRPITRFDIKQMTRLNLVTDVKAIDMYQDLGYSHDDAELQAKLSHSQEYKKKLAWMDSAVRASGAKLLKSIISNFGAGFTSAENTRILLHQIGFESRDADQLMQAAEAENFHNAANDSLKAVRSSYNMGAINEVQSRLALRSIGINDISIDYYISRWKVQRTLPRRMATVTQIVNWFASGLLTQEQTIARLDNLGVVQSDQMLMIADAVKKNQRRVALDNLAAVKARSEQVRALEAVKKDAETHAKELQSTIRRLTPVSTLKKWLKKNIINDDEFINRMKAQGIPDDVILRQWKDAVGGPTTDAGQANGQQKPPQATT